METQFQNRVLICSECREEFVFTVAAQQYFAERGYTEDPKRCKACHMQYKRTQRGQHHHDMEHQEFQFPD
ncbi:MAG: zinc-ribbon domain-containing protein [candidate division Zixibacteria bacterium]|nr:zinc-ribbon domain-containing protein [candidate division Zixibacteria bacterium]